MAHNDNNNNNHIDAEDCENEFILDWLDFQQNENTKTKNNTQEITGMHECVCFKVCFLFSICSPIK